MISNSVEYKKQAWLSAATPSSQSHLAVEACPPFHPSRWSTTTPCPLPRSRTPWSACPSGFGTGGQCRQLPSTPSSSWARALASSTPPWVVRAPAKRPLGCSTLGPSPAPLHRTQCSSFRQETSEQGWLWRRDSFYGNWWRQEWNLLKKKTVERVNWNKTIFNFPI